jgi:ketosteroid isomerase-like protein
MAFDIHAYVADFNKGDDAACVTSYYTEDTVIEGPDRTMHGRQEWIDMLQFVHQGISEKLTPLAYAQNGDVLLSEMQVEFTATQDCPDFMHGPLKQGESVTSRFFASYKLRGDQISRLALAWWPAI